MGAKSFDCASILKLTFLFNTWTVASAFTDAIGSLTLGWVDDGENSDVSIGETSVEVLLVLGPGKGSATNLGVFVSVLTVKVVGLVSVNELSVGKIIHSNTVFGTNDEPVNLGGEKHDVNG